MASNPAIKKRFIPNFTQENEGEGLVKSRFGDALQEGGGGGGGAGEFGRCGIGRWGVLSEEEKCRRGGRHRSGGS